MKLKHILNPAFLFLITLSNIHAVSTQDISLETTAASFHSVKTSPSAEFFTYSLGAQNEQLLHIGQLEISSTHPLGFKLNLISENLGLLTRTQDGETYVLNPDFTDRIDYKITLQNTSEGSLGTSLPSSSVLKNLTLESSKTIPFDVNILAPTVAKKFNILISTPQKANLHDGIYKDKITISILDI